uniref:Reverse transcriptase domain-containing protein n=1 Tax=Tanacetum cinerariifolium TaxID=118510 RepID=A0A699HR37_TANCI|nr:hypothetical protein [Tanacetum cinerariifolium]
MLRDIDETFCTLRKINMKLNPKKCTFGAVEGMFLGYMIIPEGIKPCPDGTKDSDFHLTPEAKQAFKQLKQHLSELPMLVAPKPKEELIVYPSASHKTISAVLMTEKDTVQTSVYFISCALKGPKLNYTPMEKLVLALVFAAKGQILSDFLVEKTDEAPPDTLVVENPQEQWTLFMDGPSCVDRSEYEALIASLQIATQIGVRNGHINLVSKLLANQVLGTYVTKEENVIKYLEKAKSLVSGFVNFSISQVPRSKNKKANALSKTVSTIFAHLSKQVLVEVLKEKSIQEKEVVTVVEEDRPTWMTPIMEYLKDGTLPHDKRKASKLRIKARHMHAGPRSVVAKAMWLGYYWTTIHRDARDMIRKSGPFPKGPGKVKFLIVAMDYFTKWIEAKAVATITGSQVKKSVWDSIVCHFGLLGEIVSDNEIKMPTYRVAVVDTMHNAEELWLNLDLLEERRECASIREANAKLKMTKYYNARVRGVTFRPGDFVYHSNDASHVVDGGKLGPKWEGPYEVTEVLGDGVYMLRSMDGPVLPRTWNITNLKKCYIRATT